MKNLKRNAKGITLIALVITIIILLILAGVTLNIALGENGLFKMASQSGEVSKDVAEEEKVKLAVSGAFLDGIGTLTKNNLETALKSEFGEDKVTDTTFTGTGPWTFKGERKSYTIETNGKITSGSSSSGDGGQETGKTASELYDGHNDPTDEANYKEDAMHIGDYVDYDAGEWEEDKPAPTYKTPFTFGGYTTGQSRNENATGYHTSGTYGEPKYSGWRIWDISEEGKITLISAGCPEVYYHINGTNRGYISEYILTGNVNNKANAEDLGLGTTYTPRDWSTYKNEHEYVEEARAMKKSDLDKWYGKYIDSAISDSYNITKVPANTDNKLISVVRNGMYYWICSVDDYSQYLNLVSPPSYKIVNRRWHRWWGACLSYSKI